MLGRLADLSQLEFVDRVFVKEIVEGECEAAFESGARAEACAEGDVACEDGVEVLHLAAALDDFAADSEHISRPALARGILLAETELGVVVDVDREDAHFVGAVGADVGHDHFVDGAGEHEAPVVIGVLADQVDAAGRCIERAFAAEFFIEDLFNLFSHFVFHVFSYVVALG